MTERTKGPWGQRENRLGMILDKDGEWIADCEFRDNDGEDEANAAAIVKWENCFDDLVRALENAAAFMEGVMQERGDSGVSFLIKDARAAIAKAKS